MFSWYQVCDLVMIDVNCLQSYWLCWGYEFFNLITNTVDAPIHVGGHTREAEKVPVTEAGYLHVCV